MANGAGNTRQRIEAPPVTPSPFGLFSAATVQDTSGTEENRWIHAGITWEPAHCGPAYTTVAACLDAEGDDPEDPTAKTITDGIDAVEGAAFAAYHLHRCTLPGHQWDTVGRDRAADALRLGEQRAAEQVMMDRMAIAAAGTDGIVLNSDPQHVVDAIGRLERYLGANYGGVGVLHMDPLVATLAESYNLLQTTGTRKQTRAATTTVAVGGGYGAGLVPSLEGGSPATGGVSWVYATGQVLVRRAATEVIQSAAGSLRTNQYVALAERPYVLGWECVTAAIAVAGSYAGTVPEPV